MNDMRVLAIVITRSMEYCRITVKSLKSQTLKPKIHIEIGYPIPNVMIGKLVCIYINKALSQYNLSDYDYILKSDEDVVYPKNFLEANTRLGFDLLGHGESLLIKRKTFVEYMNGRFIPNNFHAGLIHNIYKERGLKRLYDYPKVKPDVRRKQYRNPIRSFWTGFDHYRFIGKKLRYFFWILRGTFTFTPFLVFCLIGYLYAGLSRQQQYLLTRKES